jgi:4-amino-4-deoxy-L-arabinose transferase-like glycosyltransferase
LNLLTWSNLLPLFVFLVSAGLAVFARFRGWAVAVPENQPAIEEQPSPKEEPLPIRERLKRFIRQNRWGLILTGALVSVFLFTILFAPPRLTGKIPPEPNVPGRPFYSLHWGRTFLRDHTDEVSAWTNILSSLLCLAVAAIAIRRRSRLHAEIALLLASLSIAILAQWTLGKAEIQTAGAALYIVALFGFLYWGWLARARLARDLEPAPAKRGVELALIFSLLALTAFARFYVLASVPYGIEGDEAKWTSEAVNLDIAGKPDISGEYHRDALPVSFYLQAPFHRLFGASQLSARIAVAFLSVLASLVFYWLMRQMAPFPLAALATFLLAVSIFDISASRLANVESFVKIGAVLPLALLAFALKGKPWQAYTLAGLALALAALTYDTLWPIGGICLIHILIELRKQQIPYQEKVKAFAALFVPAALAMPVLIPYFVSRVSYYELSKKGWDANSLKTLWEQFVNVLQSWFVALRPDFLYNRPGPLLNAALLPWLAAGFAAAIILVRVRSARWMLVWVALILFPVPILANSPMGRVYYPALPAVYGLIAFGLFLFWKEIQRIISVAYRPLLTAVALIPLVWLPLSNFYIYFNEVSEPEDRQMRREIGDLMAESAAPDTLILLAVVPGANEPLNNEIQIMDLSVLNHLTPKQAVNSYRPVALEDVLPFISAQFADWKNLVIVLDKRSPERHEDRLALTEGLKSCYPQGTLIQGYFFDRYVLTESARRTSDCTPVKFTLSVQQPPEMQWELSSGKATFINLQCDRQARNYQWLEAEQFSLSPGWQNEINFASGWTGTGFLTDGYGSQLLSYDMESTFDKPEIYVWVRSFKRVVDNSPVYLTVNGVTLPYANTTEEFLNQWNWERVGPFPNSGSIVRITIARPYNENVQHFMAIFTDAFIVTDDPFLAPTSGLTETLPPQGFMIASSATSGLITPNLPPGQYSCHLELRSTQNLVDAFGRQPVISNEVEFRVP